LIADPAASNTETHAEQYRHARANDRFVQSVNKLPITPNIPYRSIIGDRGRGDTPNSSDGIVPYWSSHLDGAKSELCTQVMERNTIQKRSAKLNGFSKRI
jgi:hypothetical protein